MTMKAIRCAIYTRVSTEQGLEQDFNSLDAQHDASQAYVRSQAHAGWTLLRAKYDDGGFSGGNTDRPALQRLLQDVRAGKIVSTGRGISSLWGVQFSPLGGLAISRFLDQRLRFSAVDHDA